MPVLYTHLIPATFGGRARMNVANALAAAAAAWAAGAHLHDIRQGLRTFSTSFFQAPGRLNLLDVGGIRVVIDYCHNVDGMRQLADFVERMMIEPQSKAGRIGPSTNGHTRTGRAIGVIGIPGDRRDDDQREYGAIAARRVRRDHRPRGQEPSRPGARASPAGNVHRGRSRGARERRAGRCKSERILDEMTAVRTALRRAAPGDLVVCCVDNAIGVYREAMAAAGHRPAGRRRSPIRASSRCRRADEPAGPARRRDAYRGRGSARRGDSAASSSRR